MTETPPRRTQSERTKTAREKLMMATLELVAERGLEGFSIADVGARAGVSRGLPRHHFGTRQRLMAAALAEGFRDAEPRTANGLEPLRSFLRESLATPDAPKVRALLAVLAAPATDEEASAAARDFLHRTMALVEADLRSAVEAAAVASDVDPSGTGGFLVSALLGELLIAQSLSPDQIDARRRSFLQEVDLLLAEPTADR